jgi:hypothetical protein
MSCLVGGPEEGQGEASYGPIALTPIFPTTVGLTPHLHEGVFIAIFSVYYILLLTGLVTRKPPSLEGERHEKLMRN